MPKPVEPRTQKYFRHLTLEGFHFPHVLENDLPSLFPILNYSLPLSFLQVSFSEEQGEYEAENAENGKSFPSTWGK